MNYTTLEAALEQAGLAMEVDALSVYRAFEQIQDGRHKQGVRYSSALILTLIVVAKLAGMTSESFPCAATYSNVVRTLDAQQVTQVLNDFLTRVGAMKRDGEHVCSEARAVEEEAQAHVARDSQDATWHARA